jgi:hypothetical protein
MSKKPQKQKTKSGLHNTKAMVIASISVAIVLIIICIILVVLLLSKPNDTENSTPKVTRDYLVTPDNVDDMIASLDDAEVIPTGSYEVKMNSEWRFRDSSQPSYNAFVANVINNTQDVFFDVIENESGEVIYESPIIPVGSSLENISLDVDLASGAYNCTLIYHLLDVNGEEFTSLQVAIDIIIENESTD